MSSYLVDRLIHRIIAIFALEPKVSKLARRINTSELAKKIIRIGVFLFQLPLVSVRN